MAHVAYEAGKDKYQHFTSMSSSCRHNLPTKRAQCHSCWLCCASCPHIHKVDTNCSSPQGLIFSCSTKQLITRAEASFTKKKKKKRPKCQKQEAQGMKWESSRNRCSVFRVSIKASDNLKSPADIKVGRQWSERTDCMERKKCPMEFVTCLP